MRCCTVVRKNSPSEKFTLVMDPKQKLPEIARILDARRLVVIKTASEIYGPRASTFRLAKEKLFEDGRIVFVRAADKHTYMVLDHSLQKRSRYYVFQEWAKTSEGEQHLWKQDRRSGWWSQIPRESETGLFALHRHARGVFKTYCDHTFGGQVWFDVLNQMGGCPAEFVDAYNAVLNQRLSAIDRPLLDEAQGPLPRDMPEPKEQRPAYMKYRARRLYEQAARLVHASMLDDKTRREIERLRAEADGLEAQRWSKMMDMERAAIRPATQYTYAAAGAEPGEPFPQFARALFQTLRGLEISDGVAKTIVRVDSGEGEKGKDGVDTGKGMKGMKGQKGQKGEGKQ